MAILKNRDTLIFLLERIAVQTGLTWRECSGQIILGVAFREGTVHGVPGVCLCVCVYLSGIRGLVVAVAVVLVERARA